MSSNILQNISYNFEIFATLFFINLNNIIDEKRITMLRNKNCLLFTIRKKWIYKNILRLSIDSHYCARIEL